MTDPTRTYAEAVLQILKRKFDDPFKPFWGVQNAGARYTWVFEYVSPKNRIVTQYEKDELILLGIFRKEYAAEIGANNVDNCASANGFERPLSIKTDSLSQVLAALDDVGLLDEGYVIYDHRFNRIKIKNPGYLAVSRAVNAGAQLSPRHFATIVLNGDTDEIASYYDEFADMLFLMRGALEDMLNEVEDLWHKNRDAGSRKELALSVKHHPLSSLIFMLADGRIENMSGALSHVKPEYLANETKRRHKETFNAVWNKVLSSRGQNREEETEDAKINQS